MSGFSDVSSRRVLQIAGLASAAVLALTALAGWAGLGTNVWVFAGLLYLLMIAYEGVRNGRSTHLVDMAPENRRAAYTAVSNTIIGAVLIFGGVFGVLAGIAGPGAVLLVFAAMCLGAAALAQGLEQVQG